MRENGKKKNIVRRYTNPAKRYFNVSFPIQSAKPSGSLRSTGIGKKMSTPIKLNRKWTIAMLSPLAVFEFKNAAINAVTVVPMFAPRIKGAACLSFTIFCATIGTTTDVVMVLDRMAAVVNKPQAKDLSGLLKKKRLKTSGDFAFKRSEINLLKIRMDAKSKATAAVVRKNGLGILAIKKLVMELNPNQKWLTLFSTCSGDGVKNKLEIELDTVDRNP